MNISNYFEKPSSPRRILVIQLGDIGDVVWMLPATEAIRNAWPQAQLSILLRYGNGSLLSAVDPPLHTFEVPRKRGNFFFLLADTVSLIVALRRRHFDVVFDFRADERGGYMAFLTGAPFRAALHYPSLHSLRNRFFTHLVGLSGKPLAVGAADQSLYILQAFGITIDDPVPKLRLSQQVLAEAQEILGYVGLPSGNGGIASESSAERGTRPRRWVTLNPFSRWPYKEWGIEKWVQIIDWLHSKFSIASVIVGSAGEKKRADAIVEKCSGEVFNLAGKTTLGELAGLLKFSRLHIGVDSAAPHIAAAVGTPTVTIYGPSDWRYWAPPAKTNLVVFPEMSCAPCHLKGCNNSGRSLCLETLEVEKVQAVITKALS